jgi:hypothetical protein
MTKDHLNECTARREVHSTGSARLVIVALILVAGLMVLGINPRLRRDARAEETVRESTNNPIVAVTKVRIATGSSELHLPGNVQPINVAVIHARTSGYIHERFVDIGTPEFVNDFETPTQRI